MSAPTSGDEGVKQQSENIEGVVNQVAPEVQTEPTKSRLSRREELEIWQAQKLAKRAKTTAPKTPARPDRFSIIPSSIHQKCKEHTTPIAAASSSTIQKPAPTPLHQQHAAQATKLLHSHTPVKSQAPVPQTAPKSITSQRRTSIATEAPVMPVLMTPQNKPRGPNIAAKSTTAAPVQMAPFASNHSQQQSSEANKPIAAKMTVAIPDSSKRIELPMLEATTQTTTTGPQPQPTQKKPTMTDSQVQIILSSVIWRGLVDAWAIKLLEGEIHRRCISILKFECPREGDDANSVMDKYVRGKEAFEALESSYKNMIQLLVNQTKNGMQLPQKPFKTAYFYLYRAIFEEFHEQVPEATTFYELAITEGVEPRHHVMSSFKHFCGRIRELTQQQMTTRPSLAVGVRRLQESNFDASAAAKEDAKALADLLEEDEDDDFGMDDVMDAAEQEEQFEDEILEFEEQQASERANTMDFEEHVQDEQLSEISDSFESVEMVEEDLQEEAHVLAPKNSIIEEELPSNRTMEEVPKRSKIEPSVEAPAQFPPRPVPESSRTPAKLQALSHTPLGKPKRIRLFEENDAEDGADGSQGGSSHHFEELDTFTVVYETTKPSKRTRMVIADSDKVVTPMRRSNRIAQPLRADQSTTASDLLPSANWSYQPNDALFDSGKMDAIKAPAATPVKKRAELSLASPAVHSSSAAASQKQNGATPHRRPIAPQHLVPRSAAVEKLAQINAVPKTPSRMGPPRRVPIAFDEELDEDNTMDKKEEIRAEEAPDVDEIARGLKSIEIPSSTSASTSTSSASSPLSSQANTDIMKCAETVLKEREASTATKSPLSGSASSLSLSLDCIGNAGTASGSSSFYSARATFDTEDDDEDEFICLRDVEVDPAISTEDYQQQENEEAKEENEEAKEESQLDLAPVETQERRSKRSTRRSILPTPPSSSSSITSTATSSSTVTSSSSAKITSIPVTPAKRTSALRQRIVLPAEVEDEAEDVKQTPSHKSSVRRRIQPAVEEEASKTSEEDSATPPVEPTPYQNSLYLAMRKAAYSGQYGSGYVATPSKTSGSSTSDEQEFTPARRSRRLATKENH